MPISRRNPASLLCLAALGLTSCQTFAPVRPDPRVAELAGSIEQRSAAFFATLAGKQAPACDFAHNAPVYAELASLAGQLRDHAAAISASPAMRRAADALARTIATARSSHERASAEASDPAGVCMAGGAIALNADAVARASRAIAATQTEREGR